MMIGLIARTYTSTGGSYKKNKDNVAVTVDELSTDLQKYLGTLSFSELELAFKNGWKKQTTAFSEKEKEEHFQKYGKTKDDFFGLNNATYFGWVNAYAHGESRLKAKKAISEAIKKANHVPEISQEEKNKIIRHGCIQCFEDFKKTGKILDIGNVNYSYLFRLGLINHSPEVKKKMLTDVTERLKTQEKSKLHEREYIGQHSVIKYEIEQIEVGKSTRLITEGKRESLKIYFKNLLEMEINLIDLIKK